MQGVNYEYSIRKIILLTLLVLLIVLFKPVIIIAQSEPSNETRWIHVKTVISHSSYDSRGVHTLIYTIYKLENTTIDKRIYLIKVEVQVVPGEVLLSNDYRNDYVRLYVDTDCYYGKIILLGYSPTTTVGSSTVSSGFTLSVSPIVIEKYIIPLPSFEWTPGQVSTTISDVIIKDESIFRYNWFDLKYDINEKSIVGKHTYVVKYMFLVSVEPDYPLKMWAKLYIRFVNPSTGDSRSYSIQFDIQE